MQFQHIFTPKEQAQALQQAKKELFIGIPKEISFQEKRVPLVPDAVALLVANGHDVMIEQGAGEQAGFSDHDYAEAGAMIAYDNVKVFEAQTILKITPPHQEEINLLKPNQMLFSALQSSLQQETFYQDLVRKKVTAFAFDFIRDKSGIHPVVRSMGEIAGSTSILIAAEYLGNTKYGKGVMLGGVSGVPPTEVVIIGAGTVSEFAARTALGLGAYVKVFDNSLYKLRRLQTNLNTRLFTSILHPNELKTALKTADVIIGSLRSSTGKTPCILTEEMMELIPTGSVFIDVSIDQGGLAYSSRVTTHDNPVYIRHGVTHYCVPNIASRVPNTASINLSNILTPILLDIGENGGLDNYLKSNDYNREGVYIYKGCLTNRHLAEDLKLPFKDLNLILATF